MNSQISNMAAPSGSDTETFRNPSPPRSEILPPGISKSELHPDTVGDTVFSKQWLFSTLMSLIQTVEENESEQKSQQSTTDKTDEEDEEPAQTQIDPDMESKLCQMWDMSMEKDVSYFLHEFKVIEILYGVIMKSKVDRVQEISIGILGNMSCQSDLCVEISNYPGMIDLMILLIRQVADTGVLAESTRLMTVGVANPGCQDVWLTAVKDDECLPSSIVFMLKSTTSNDLLRNLGDLIDNLFDISDDILALWTSNDFIHAVCEAQTQYGFTGTEFENINTINSFMHILQMTSTIEQGLVALVDCSDTVYLLVRRFLFWVWDHDLFSDCIAGLASAFSLLHVIYNIVITTRKFELIKQEPGVVWYLCNTLKRILTQNESSQQSSTSVKTPAGSSEGSSGQSVTVATKTEHSDPSESLDEKSAGPSGDTAPSTAETNDVQSESAANANNDLFKILESECLEFFTEIMSSLDENEQAEQNDDTGSSDDVQQVSNVEKLFSLCEAYFVDREAKRQTMVGDLCTICQCMKRRPAAVNESLE